MKLKQFVSETILQIIEGVKRMHKQKQKNTTEK